MKEEFEDNNNNNNNENEEEEEDKEEKLSSFLNLRNKRKRFKNDNDNENEYKEHEEEHEHEYEEEERRQKIKQEEKEVNLSKNDNISDSYWFSDKNIALIQSNYAKKEAITKELEEKGEITYQLFTNNGESDSVIALTTLKNIFARQLPKMPKDYIVRLVFDRRHYSLAIIRNSVIIGGICYRPYFPQRFAEIAFCAVNSTEQVRGFGTILMNNLKNLVQKQNIEYFLTFADNYAIGYFQKQGFTKQISLAKDRWVGYIKEYDGGTLMECYIHPGVDYLNISRMIAYQRAFLYYRILVNRKSNVVYPGLDIFRSGSTLQTPFEIPGVLEGGWTLQSNIAPRGISDRDRSHSITKVNIQLKTLFERIRSHPDAWPFLEAVTDDQAPGYSQIITNPIDLNIIGLRLKEQTRSTNDSKGYYRTKEMLRADLLRMTNNCKTYNPPESEYYMIGHRLEKFINEIFSQDSTTPSASNQK